MYLEMIDAYAKALKVKLPKSELHSQALEWATTRGARSGRVAWQFMQDTAGR
jgi:predicted AAA+ superfamily ATPase